MDVRAHEDHSASTDHQESQESRDLKEISVSLAYQDTAE